MWLAYTDSVNWFMTQCVLYYCLSMYVKGRSHCANPRASATRTPHATLRNTRQLHSGRVLRAGVLQRVAECCTRMTAHICVNGPLVVSLIFLETITTLQITFSLFLFFDSSKLESDVTSEGILEVLQFYRALHS